MEWRRATGARRTRRPTSTSHHGRRRRRQPAPTPRPARSDRDRRRPLVDATTPPRPRRPGTGRAPPRVDRGDVAASTTDGAIPTNPAARSLDRIALSQRPRPVVPLGGRPLQPAPDGDPRQPPGHRARDDDLLRPRRPARRSTTRPRAIKQAEAASGCRRASTASFQGTAPRLQQSQGQQALLIARRLVVIYIVLGMLYESSSIR